MNIFEEIVQLQKNNESFAVATIIASKGSTPRHIGKMIVKKDGQIKGTIGGGLAESFVIQEAIHAIKNKQSKTVEYTLNSDEKGGIKMYCGGSLSLFIEVIPKRTRVIIIGGGHVGQAVAHLAKTLDYQIVVVDDREAYANQTVYPMAEELYTHEDIVKALEKVKMDDNTYVLIFTKDSDESVLRYVIQEKVAFIGMIGSGRKVIKTFNKLHEEGIKKAALDKVYAPLGLDIGAETPEEIAISIIGEMMKAKNQSSGKSLKDVKRKKFE
ncbi:xanthine dehydrogenase accessory factor [Natranaerovirga hydrolytica]|uniref:Xanthine dehydrogenase accessory factor n=1 Tax=Natranaerovirga hydrolytica TaxID=680378 RepID=A0A4R1MXE2_9FIRM|nr:XdhC/CoxI family protein [Natranaerovirga hydrolytica]TCK97765.1 xanthine dehydrogenase accessory factor [Natranaerovirga hydrolytica]